MPFRRARLSVLSCQVFQSSEWYPSAPEVPVGGRPDQAHKTWASGEFESALSTAIELRLANEMEPARDYFAVIPTIGWVRRMLPVDPKKWALPNANIPPSRATSQ